MQRKHVTIGTVVEMELDASQLFDQLDRIEQKLDALTQTPNFLTKLKTLVDEHTREEEPPTLPDPVTVQYPIKEPVVPPLAEDRLAKEELLTAEAVAEFLGISPTTMSTMRARKAGPPYVRTGKVRGIRYPRDQFIRWYAANQDNLPKPRYGKRKAAKQVSTLGHNKGVAPQRKDNSEATA